MSLSMFDVWKRAENGPICPLKKFELKVLYPKVKEKIDRFGIAFDTQQVVPIDDDMIDRLWEAGVEVLTDVGVLCTDTERIIHVTRDEIEEQLKFLRPEVTLGEGSDSVTVRHRNIDDPRPPVCIAGPIAVPVSEGIAAAAYEAYAQEAAVEMFFPGAVTTVHGTMASAGSPLEMYAEKTDTARARQAFQNAGRPGVPIWGTCYTTAQGAISACNPDRGFRPSDVVHCYIQPTLKTDYGTLCKSEHFRDYGIRIWGMGTTFIGGLPGSPEGAAVTCIAECLAVYMLYFCDLPAIWTPQAMYGPGMASRESMWATCLSHAALSRHVTAPIIGWTPYQAYAGPCTDMYFYEAAASTVSQVVSGCANASFGGGCQGGKADYFGGPLDSRFLRDVAHATTALDRCAANEVVLALLGRYEDKIKAQNPPTGKRFQECNDLETLTPTDEYVELFHNVKDELAALGLTFEGHGAHESPAASAPMSR